MDDNLKTALLKSINAVTASSQTGPTEENLNLTAVSFHQAFEALIKEVESLRMQLSELSKQ